MLPAGNSLISDVQQCQAPCHAFARPCSRLVRRKKHAGQLQLENLHQRINKIATLSVVCLLALSPVDEGFDLLQTSLLGRGLPLHTKTFGRLRVLLTSDSSEGLQQ